MPALPLQLLLRREPAWRRHPAVVVDADRPQGKILWLNERAYRSGVRTGQRYAAGLSLCAGLRAGVVERAEIAAAVDGVVALMRRFSPKIEPDPVEPGVLRADLGGLGGLFDSPEAWANGLSAELRVAGWHAIVAVGFDRFRAYALTRALAAEGRDVHVCGDRSEEIARTDAVPLARLQIDPGLRDALDRLGLTDVGDLRVLPRGGLLARFGDDGARLQSLVDDGGGAGDLVGTEEAVRFTAHYELEPDEPSIDTTSLLFLIKQRLDELIDVLAARGEAVGGLAIDLLPDRSRAPESVSAVRTALQPAEATLDSVQLVDLIRLRIEMLDLEAPLVGFDLEVDPVPASRAQLELFGEEAARDLRAADRALARVRAEFGEDAVVRARLHPGHLPEAMFRWERLEHFGRAHRRTAAVEERALHRSTPRTGDLFAALEERAETVGLLGGAAVFRGADASSDETGGGQGGAPNPVQFVRRFLARPRPVRGPGREPDGWFVGGLDAGPVQNVHGPYVVSGGWWRGVPGRRDESHRATSSEVHREYHFVETRRGDVCWLFRDRARRRWYVHGLLD